MLFASITFSTEWFSFVAMRKGIRNYSANSLRNNLVCRRFMNRANYMTKKMEVPCVCCNELKIKFYCLSCKKCTLHEIESIIKSLMKFRFKSSEKIYTRSTFRRTSTTLFTRLFFSKNGRVVYQWRKGDHNSYQPSDDSDSLNKSGKVKMRVSEPEAWLAKMAFPT